MIQKLRFSQFRLKYFFFTFLIILRCNQAAAEAAVLQITIYPSTESISTAQNLCNIAEIKNCSTTFFEALKLIKEPSWQQQLKGRIDSVQLILNGGVYHVSEPIHLQWGDKATQNIALEIAAHNQARVIISGAWQPQNLKTVIATDERLPQAARGYVQQIDLSQIKQLFQTPPPARGFALPTLPMMTELFFRDAAMPIAAWPNDGYAKIKCPTQTSCKDKKTFSIENRQAKDWLGEPDLRMFAYWGFEWEDQTLAVEKIDAANNMIYLAGAGSNYPINAGQRLRVENALSELDHPGEWYINRATAQLYFWPAQRIVEGDIEMSFSPSLFVIEQSRGITFRNIQFEKTRGTPIIITKSENVVVENSIIRNVGGHAVQIEGGKNCGVKNSVIEDIGEGGIFLSGGDRPTLTPSHHFVIKNIIRRYNRLAKTYRPAVNINGVGQIIQGNKISDASHSAIIFNGNDHQIIANEISHVILETGDAGAIYTGRDYTARGTVISDNFFHDITSYNKIQQNHYNRVIGVYLDDQASGITIRNNIFARIDWPIYIGGGRDNIIDKNLFYQSGPAIYLDARGASYQHKLSIDPQGQFQKRLDSLPYRSAPYSERYPHLAQIREDDFGAPKYNVARGNIIVAAKSASSNEQFEILDAAKSGITIEGTQFGNESTFTTPLKKNGRQNWNDFVLQKKI